MSYVRRSPFVNIQQQQQQQQFVSQHDIENINIQPNPLLTQITIYNKSAHITEIYSRGTGTMILPKSVDVSSIVVMSDDTDLNIIPFKISKESSLGMNITDRETGEKTQAAVTKNNSVTEGKILYYDNDTVTLLSNNNIINIRGYDSISLPSSEDFTRPIINLDRPPMFDIKLSYMIANVSWNCVGTAIINNKNKTLYLRLAANIVNNTESDMKGIVNLVSGDVYQIKNTARYPQMQSKSFAQMERIEDNVTPTLLEDYKKYDIGEKVLGLQNIAELGTYSYNINKLYIHDTSSANKVKYGYRLVAKNFIPACDLYVYSINDKSSIDSFLGSTNIEEAQIGKDVKIILGETTLLQCISTIESVTNTITDVYKARTIGFPQTMIANFSDSEYKLYETVERLKVTIKNYNKDITNLVIRHHVGNKYISNVNCMKYKREGDYIEWFFQIEPTKTDKPSQQEFTCDIKMLSSNKYDIFEK